ncbi:MAG: preprotein translocase subunit SecD family protein [Christensenellales bacterium]
MKLASGIKNALQKVGKAIKSWFAAVKKVAWIIRFALVVLLVAAFCVAGFAGIALGRYDLFPFWQQTKKGMDIQSGTQLLFAASKDTGLSEEDINIKLDETVQMMRERLDVSGYPDAVIARQGQDRVVVDASVDSTGDVAEAADLLTFLSSQGKLEFFDPDNNLIIDQTHVEGVTAISSAAEKYGLAFLLTSEGKEIIAKASETLTGKTITIKLDSLELASVEMSDEMADGEFSLSGGGFTKTKALKAAYAVQSGALPLELVTLGALPYSATLGENVLQNLNLGVILGAVLLLLLLVLVYRLPGLILGLSVIFYGALALFFLAAFQVVATSATLCGLLFGLLSALVLDVSALENARSERKIGHSLKASLASGFKKTNKSVWLLAVLLLAAAIVLLLVGSAGLGAFALAAILGITAAYVSFLLAHYIIHTLVDFNITKGWLFFGADKARKEVA